MLFSILSCLLLFLLYSFFYYSSCFSPVINITFARLLSFLFDSFFISFPSYFASCCLSSLLVVSSLPSLLYTTSFVCFSYICFLSSLLSYCSCLQFSLLFLLPYLFFFRSPILSLYFFPSLFLLSLLSCSRFFFSLFCLFRTALFLLLSYPVTTYFSFPLHFSFSSSSFPYHLCFCFTFVLILSYHLSSSLLFLIFFFHFFVLVTFLPFLIILYYLVTSFLLSVPLFILFALLSFAVLLLVILPLLCLFLIFLTVSCFS